MNKVYAYIADNDPLLAKQIIEHFGYRVVSTQNMADNLQQLVSEEGEEALKLIMNNHPDKEVIIELFSQSPAECVECNERSSIEKYSNSNSDTYSNANGLRNTEASKVENNFSILFLAGVMILAVAIIKK